MSNLNNIHPASELLRTVLTPVAKPAPASRTTVFDDTGDDSTADPAGYASTDLRVKAANIVQTWAATDADSLGDDENLADRLLMLVIGAIDVDKDGEISDDEAQVASVLLDYIWDYLASKGVSDEDCEALLDNGDVDAAARVKDLLSDSLPSEDDAAADDVDAFAFDDEAQTALFDSAGEVIFDAAYKKKVAVRNGHKIRINKRVSGTVRLSAKQKIAVKKMLRKSHSASATIKRMKSMRMRSKAGL
jgi:hypothetical protein